MKSLVTAIMFGLNYEKAVKEGTVFLCHPFEKDIPTQYFTIAHEVPDNINSFLNKNLQRIAEEMFDLTNNPGREDERVKHRYNFRSVSSGDVIMINIGFKTVYFICKSIGWIRIVENPMTVIARLEADGTWLGRSKICQEMGEQTTA